MSDFDDLFDWTLKSAAQVSMEVSAGKLEGFEGGLRAFPRLEKPLWRRHEAERVRGATRRNGK
jgi:hypothetical protein